MEKAVPNKAGPGTPRSEPISEFFEKPIKLVFFCKFRFQLILDPESLRMEIHKIFPIKIIRKKMQGH